MSISEIPCALLLLFRFVFLLRLVLSFFPIQPDTSWASVRSFAVAATEPVVVPIRRAVPPLPGSMAAFGVAELLILIGIEVLVAIIC
ncbi:MAG: YggT family protein [Acidimicrobiia bacterium]|nr:YggT family protein [Acidimicrobiia bacterium]